MSAEDLLPEWQRLAGLKDKMTTLLGISCRAALIDACTEVAQLRAVLKRVREERDAALLQLAQCKRPLIPRRP